MRVTASALALGSVLTLGACGPERSAALISSPEPDPSPAPVSGSATPEPAPTATVQATAARGEAPEGFPTGQEGVLVEYTVRNEGPGPIKVATDRGPGQARSSVTASAAVWVSAGSSTDVARLSKQVFGIPDGVLPTDLHRAGSTTVEPGGTLEDTAFVTLPLATDLPEGTRTITVTEDPMTRPDGVRRVEVCVQLAPGPAPGQEESYASTIAADARDTVTACSDPVDLPQTGR